MAFTAVVKIEIVIVMADVILVQHLFHTTGFQFNLSSKTFGQTSKLSKLTELLRMEVKCMDYVRLNSMLQEIH